MSETELPPEAQAALDAYQQMTESKAHYFALLQEIDETDSSTPEQEAELAERLKVHDTNVKAYHNAMHAIEDIEIRNELIKRMM